MKLITPVPQSLKAYGILAHVDPHERERVMALDSGNRKRYLEYLEKQISRKGKK